MSGVLALVLGRAGSKGVPGKNLAPVAGRACAEWTLDHVSSARTIHTRALSTDCPALTRLAAACSLATVARPAALAADSATVNDAARHALQVLEARHNLRFAHIAILYANVPVRPAGLLDRAVRACIDCGRDSVQSYCPVGKHHPWWTARLDAAGAVAPWDGDILNHGVYRRQDLPPAFIPDGGVLVVTRAALMLEVPGVAPGPHAFFGRSRGGITTAEGEVIDIDSALDLIVADAVLRARHPALHTPSRSAPTRVIA
ncbi:N/A [soil metagenome]